MKTIIYNIFFTLIPCLAWAQYPSNGNQKITLGEQTTADGLIFRGVASIDTVSSTSKITRANKQDTSTYILLDTVTNLLWHYKIGSNAWIQAGGGVSVSSFSAGTTGLTPSTATTGAVTLAGTLGVGNGGTGADMSSLPNNYLVRKNSSGIYDTSAVYEAGGNVGIGVEPTNISKLDLSGQLRIRASGYTTSSLESNLLIVGNTNNTGLFTGTIPPSLFVVNRRTLNNSLARIGFNAGDGEVYGYFIADGYGAGLNNDGLPVAGLGMVSRSTSPLLFVTDNVERVRITSTGNVGIGTPSPQTKLHIAQSSSAVLFSESSGTATIIGTNAAGTASQELSLRGFPLTFTGNGGGGSEHMRITSTGNVGIGTASPGNLLTIKDKSQIGFRDEASNSTRNALQNYAYTLGYGDGLRIGEQYNAVSIAGNVGIGTTNPSSKLEIFQATYTGSTNYVTKNIKINSGFGSGYVSGTIVSLLSGYDGTTIYGTDIGHSYDGTGYSLIFSTNDNTGGDVIERMRITREGNVTIGNSISTGILTSGSTTIGNINAKSFLLGTNGTETNYRWQNYIDASNNYKLYSRGYGDALSIGYTTGAATFTNAVKTGTATDNGLSGEGIVINANVNGIRLVTPQSTNTYETLAMYSSGAGAYRFYVGWGGTIYATSTTITAISDQRLKENVRPLNNGLSIIDRLNPVMFDWKEGKGLDKKNDVGFIAQEFEKVFPNSVMESLAGDDGISYKALNHGELIPTLVKAVQELSAQVDILKQEIINLKNK